MEIDSSARQHFQGIAGRISRKRFGEPFTHVFLALHTCGLQMIDAQTTHRRDQECFRGSDFAILRGLLPTDEGFLQEVFGVGHAADHPVGNREQEAAILVERR